MKVPKSEFIRFKKEFLRLQNLLNLRCYKIHFEFQPIKFNALAEITINQCGKVATVIYASELSKDNFINRGSPEQCAAHEAAHLFISKLSFLAEERYTTKAELADEEEQIARILEQVL